MLLTKLYRGGNNDGIYKLFPPRESLVSDILAGDGNIEKLFYGEVTNCEESEMRTFPFGAKISFE
jgi:hypothetical protein